VSKLLRKERIDHTALCLVAREVLAGTLGAGEADLATVFSRNVWLGRAAERAAVIEL
jgi:hypothetical protein